MSIFPARPAPRRPKASICKINLGKKLKENGWFVGYAPRRNPEIVVAALVQAGGWGSTSAAPIVRDVVKAYYDKKNGHFQPQPSTADKHAAVRSSAPGSACRLRGSAAAMKDRPRVQDFDWPLLAIVGAISAIGVLEIYSSTHASAHGRHAVEATDVDRRSALPGCS